MKKRLLGILFAAVMVLCMIPTVLAADTVASGECGNSGSVTWTLDSEGKLTISGSGDMDDYDNVPWYNYCQSIRTVTIEKGVTSISGRAFAGCSSLTSVRISDSVTIIGPWAFEECSSLVSINLPDSVTAIGMQAFKGCSSLTSITIPNSMTYIEWLMFESCYSLTSVTIPDSVTLIGTSAFRDCRSLVNVTIPDSVTEIEWMAFKGCSSLTSIVIPSSVIAIFANAFMDCSNLTSITFQGDAPGSDPTGDPNLAIFLGVTATAYYPENNNTWTDSVKENFGGNITWVPYSEKEPTPPVTFEDVTAGAYYAPAVNWAVANNITAGTTPTTFSPDNTCTRGQIVAFLWRAAGRPEPETTINPFADVKTSDYFYKAVLWASENGIVYGTSGTTFSPNQGCTRGQVAAFLWRAAGRPEPTTGNNPFTDVKTSEYYGKAVVWAAENKIVYGTSATQFSPNASCTRAQIVTFLYRTYAPK